MNVIEFSVIVFSQHRNDTALFNVHSTCMLFCHLMLVLRGRSLRPFDLINKSLMFAGGSDNSEGGSESGAEEVEGGAAKEDGAARRAVRADHRGNAPKTVGECSTVCFPTLEIK